MDIGLEFVTSRCNTGSTQSAQPPAAGPDSMAQQVFMMAVYNAHLYMYVYV